MVTILYQICLKHKCKSTQQEMFFTINNINEAISYYYYKATGNSHNIHISLAIQQLEPVEVRCKKHSEKHIIQSQKTFGTFIYNISTSSSLALKTVPKFHYLQRQPITFLKKMTLRNAFFRMS